MRQSARVVVRVIAGAAMTTVVAGLLGLPMSPAFADGVSSTTTQGITGFQQGDQTTAISYEYGTGTVGPDDSSVDLEAWTTRDRVNFVLTVERGPLSVAPASMPAGSYQIAAFIRLDGSGRGIRVNGPVGTAAVPMNTRFYPDGFQISGAFTDLAPGTHALTLTDLLLDYDGAANGGLRGTVSGSDTYYNKGTDFASVVTAPTDWTLSDANLETTYVPKATVSAVKNGSISVPAVTPPAARAGDTFAVSSTSDWSANADLGFTICTDPDGVDDGATNHCATGAVQDGLWNTASSGDWPTVNGSGHLDDGRLQLAATSTYIGVKFLKVYEVATPDRYAMVPLRLLPAAEVTSGVATVALGGSVAVSGRGFYPQETVTLRSNASGDRTTTKVADANGTFTADVPVTKPSATRVVATGIGSSVVTEAFTVTSDKVGPVVTITVPKKPTAVKSWKKLRGTATDATGVRAVTVSLVQKRGHDWYAYSGTTWTSATSKGAAVRAAATITVARSAGSWKHKIRKLAAGKLTIRYAAVDTLGNAAPARALKQKLR